MGVKILAIMAHNPCWASLAPALDAFQLRRSPKLSKSHWALLWLSYYVLLEPLVDISCPRALKLCLGGPLLLSDHSYICSKLLISALGSSNKPFLVSTRRKKQRIKLKPLRVDENSENWKLWHLHKETLTYFKGCGIIRLFPSHSFQ